MIGLFADPAGNPTPVPTGGGGGGNGPGIDVGALVNGIVNGILDGFQTILITWTQSLPKLFADALNEDIRKAWNDIWSSGANLFATPPELTIAFLPGVQLWLGTQTLVYGIIVIAIALLALRNILRTITGHGGTLDDAVNGILLGSLLAGASFMLMTLAFQMTRLASDAFGRFSYAPTMPSSNNPSIALGIVTLIVIFVYSFRLWIRAAYRLVLVMFLAPFAPIAGALWAIPQTKWITVLYFVTMGGWLAGGFLALGALSLGVQLATIGNTNGIVSLIFGVGLVQLAYDLMGLLPKAFTGQPATGGPGFRAFNFMGGAIGADAASAAVGGGAVAAGAAGSAGTALAVAGGNELAGFGY